MAPLISLLVGWLGARLAGLLGVVPLDNWQGSLRVGVALMFVVTGVVHFVHYRADLVAMVPPALPRPELLVTVTGVLELLGAAGLLVPATASAAGYCLAALLLVMFPANVHAARQRLTLGGRQVEPLPRRTALQVVFLAAAVASAI
ncbi:DoxX family protein [Goodfellowiella coeruleoviolacea]|uniref:Membrane protein n=1 Tax=Goodfellowiella coeruleoviolacea TaxID=334858 RepID=A0AAE3GLZ8_9PSEU|nr:DoxX family protein [Goodfellowiella coeruleoviolacea]MCP2169749.1 putative membrane protein [Goodfellowiella coeruleoviolacea]